jgi:hypothetical protein
VRATFAGLTEQTFEVYQKAVLGDDASELSRLLDRYSELESRIDEPAFFFWLAACGRSPGRLNACPTWLPQTVDPSRWHARFRLRTAIRVSAKQEISRSR